MFLYKGNSKIDKNNYRLILVFFVFFKIFERYLYNFFYVFFNVNDFLYQLQFVFRKYYLMEIVLINMFDCMFFNFDDNCINGLILVDF